MDETKTEVHGPGSFPRREVARQGSSLEFLEERDGSASEPDGDAEEKEPR